MVMGKDDDESKDLNEVEDEDLFDFDEDIFAEEEELKEKESEKEKATIDLADVAEEGTPPEPVEEDTGEEDTGEFEKLVVHEDEAPKQAGAPSEEEKEVPEDVLPEMGEMKEGVDELAKAEGPVSESPFGQEEGTGEETLVMEKMGEAVKEEPEASIDLQKEIDLDEGLEELEELLSEGNIGKLKAPLLEKAAEKETPVKEKAFEEVLTIVPPVEAKVEAEEKPVKEEAPSISEEKIESLLTRIVTDVLEKVAKEVISEVAEKIIREQIDTLKKSLALHFSRIIAEYLNTDTETENT
jgi:neurofilament medium polypeptide (neurofilament 3)